MGNFIFFKPKNANAMLSEEQKQRITSLVEDNSACLNKIEHIYSQQLDFLQGAAQASNRRSVC